jgi:hypothetical protein
MNGKVTTKRFKLQQTGSDGAAFLAAKTAHDEIAAALSDITNATLQDKTVSYVLESYNIGVGDITEQGLLNVWAEDPANANDALAISQVYVPAPNIGIFQGASGAAMDIVDVNDGNLQAFVSAIAAGAFISDNEVIDTGAAAGGIESGKRVTRKSS